MGKNFLVACVCCVLASCIPTCAQDNINNITINNYSNPYQRVDSRYDYMYANPPRPSLGAYGRYIMSSSNVRYIHSPSRLKGAKHAARINANNAYALGY